MVKVPRTTSFASLTPLVHINPKKLFQKNQNKSKFVFSTNVDPAAAVERETVEALFRPVDVCS